MPIKSVVLLMLLARVAAADEAEPTVTLARTCVEVSGTLDEPGRAAARRRLTAVLEERDLFVVEGDCSETYRVEHTGTVIRLTSSRGARRWTNADPDKLLVVYRAMVASLIEQVVPQIPETPVALERPAPAVSYVPPAPFPTPVTDFGSPPKQGGWYAALGAGAVAMNGGVMFTGGYRHRNERRIIDVRGRLQGADAGTSSGLGLGVYAVTTSDGTTLYGGGGLEVSSSTTRVDFMQMTGSGLAAFGTAGVLLGDADSSRRPFLQADLGLPTYVVRGGGQSEYPVVFSIAVGISR